MQTHDTPQSYINFELTRINDLPKPDLLSSKSKLNLVDESYDDEEPVKMHEF